MKTFSPFRPGYKSSWYRYPSLASLTKAGGGGDAPYREFCGCATCRANPDSGISRHLRAEKAAATPPLVNAAPYRG